MSRIWAGIDSGKGHHHGLALDTEGKALLSRRVANDEPELLRLISDVLALADGDEVTWAIDMTGGEPALLLSLLVAHNQEVLYLSGRLVNRASDGYRGEGKTDARDAYVIADQARIRRDLRPIRPGDEAAIDLKLLTGRRTDLVEDRTPGPPRTRSHATSEKVPVPPPLLREDPGRSASNPSLDACAGQFGPMAAPIRTRGGATENAAGIIRPDSCIRMARSSEGRPAAGRPTPRPWGR